MVRANGGDMANDAGMNREGRFEMRLRDEEKRLIQRAADYQGLSLSAFIRLKAIQGAGEVLRQEGEQITRQILDRSILSYNPRGPRMRTR